MLFDTWIASELLSSVPYTVRWIVDELTKQNLPSPTFSHVLRTIRETKTMGRDLIVPLIKVLEESRDLLLASNVEHWTKHLSAIRQHAHPR